MEISSIFLKLYLAAAAWIDLEIITLSNPERERHIMISLISRKYHTRLSHSVRQRKTVIMICLISEIYKDDTNELIYKAEMESQM